MAMAVQVNEFEQCTSILTVQPTGVRIPVAPLCEIPDGSDQFGCFVVYVVEQVCGVRSAGDESSPLARKDKMSRPLPITL